GAPAFVAAEARRRLALRVDNGIRRCEARGSGGTRAWGGNRAMKRALRRYPIRALLVAVAIIAAGGGVAWATIPSGGVISACYDKSGGALRVIDASVTNCKKTETALTWNEQGQQGATGPAGPTGPGGPAGPA